APGPSSWARSGPPRRTPWTGDGTPCDLDDRRMHSHHRQANPSDVQSGREFALVATDVRASLAVALSGPEPGPWSGRADGWENWTLDSWVSAGHRYRADTTLPVDE